MRNKKQRKHTLKKNNHTHKTIFTWFGNLPTSTEQQGFHYYQERIQRTKLRLQSFFLFFFLIKNTATPLNIIQVRSGRVVEPDQTKLGSTKPNKPSFVNLQKTSQILLTLKIILFHHKQISYSQKLEPLSNDFIAKHAVQDAQRDSKSDT